MIIEGIITTENDDGSMHVAPIGPHVNPELTQWTLKPFQSSTTFSNLRRTHRGVFHVVDDALLMAAAVLGKCNLSNASNLAECDFDAAVGWVLRDACRVFAIAIREWDVSQPRAHAECQVILQRELRPFWGWNRAANSILELSVIASRVEWLDKEYVAAELSRHGTIIEKTSGPREFAAWQLLKERLSQ